MPFGLCNAPATLVLAGLQWEHCLVYLDDVIVLGRSFNEHLQNLQTVFQRLRQAGLRLKPRKCAFFQQEVQYLGHIVSRKGIATDPSKVQKVETWPTPSSSREVQQFLGFTSYYRRFIKDFALIAKPLHKLTERNCVFRWTQSAFEVLRHHLIVSPVLAFPDFSKPFIVDTDASDTGIGAVLSQVDEDGGEQVIAYGSRLLTKEERRYCVTRRELLAVVTFTRQFRSYILGQRFLLRTDHGSLTWLRNFKEPEGQLAKWLERLQEFDFCIEHRPGRKHINADALSRLPCRQCGSKNHNEEVSIAAMSLASSVMEELRGEQLRDPHIEPVLRAKETTIKPTADEIKAMGLPSRRLFQLC